MTWKRKEIGLVSRRWFDEVAACKLLHAKGAMLVVEDETTISQHLAFPNL
jgi:hypothetical protein